MSLLWDEFIWVLGEKYYQNQGSLYLNDVSAHYKFIKY